MTLRVFHPGGVLTPAKAISEAYLVHEEIWVRFFSQFEVMMSVETIKRKDGPASGRGKWGDPSVPKRGWECVEIEDLGAPDLTCEMCDSAEIRYVHHMSHPDYTEIVQSGCICAGHMEGDLEAAALRDTQMKNAARRRAHWPNRAGWRTSAKGNPTIKVDTHRVTVFRHRDGWRAVVKDLWSGREVWARRTYPSINAAKLAAFDRMLLGV